jgi:hypothetical protein
MREGGGGETSIIYYFITRTNSLFVYNNYNNHIINHKNDKKNLNLRMTAGH